MNALRNIPSLRWLRALAGAPDRPPSQPRVGARRRLWPAAVLLLALVGAGPGATSAGSILREVWEGIPGTAVSDLTSSPDYPDHPTSTNYVTDLFESPTDVLEDYGQRMHGYVTAPSTGDYTFWIATDDGGELWLSTDSNPANKQLIAYVTGWTPSRAWTIEPNQQSAAIHLEAGRSYYIAALEKEGGGGDNLAVRWEGPNGLDEAPILASHLLPYGVAFTPPVITGQPTNTTALEGQMATFSVQVSNADFLSCRWQRNGQDIPGASGTVLNYGPVTMADQNGRFQAFLTNSLGSTATTFAYLTVLPDTEKPKLVAIQNSGQNQLVVSFSEGLAAPGATNPANYSLDKGIAITGAAFGTDFSTVLLTTGTLTYGQSYTLTVNNVTDRAAQPNAILPGSTIPFTAVQFFPTDVGNPSLPGGISYVPGGVDITGGGTTIGGTSDQFHFGWQQRSGDFDLQLRVATLNTPDPYGRAGFMARETLDQNARFAAIFASSPELGCLFESRAGTGAKATVVAPPGGYPVNYPYTWLRLQRSGSQFTGYASLDGADWTSLGSANLPGLPASIYVGFAVSGDTPTATATGQFRDLTATVSTATTSAPAPRETLGPCSRATGMVISEIMYQPVARTDGRNLEFVELYNARTVFEDLTGWRIGGDIDYAFPDGFILPAGGFVVVAAAPDDLKAVYGLTNVLGPYTGNLPGNAGTVRLRNNADAIRLEVTYSSDPPWPVAADGAGHSLVLARPSLGEADPAAWAASSRMGGSPGTMDPVLSSPQAAVVINEFLAHTDPPDIDYLELYNHSNAAVDLSGCWLSDTPATNRFRIPNDTTLPARGVVAFDSDQLGFRLNAAGETLYLVNSNATAVLDAVRFDPQENGVASGRYPDGDPTIRRLSRPTPGTVNAPWRAEAVVINEIMYAPISGEADDSYVELYNRTASPVNLSGWKFNQGIDYTFPTNTSLAAHGYLVVAKNAAHLRTNHPQLTAQNTLGDFGGNLSNHGERLELTQPHALVSTNSEGVLTTNLIRIPVAEVRYGVGGRWGQWANGGGSSLELIDPNADLLRAANWADSDETAKASWTTVAVTNRLDNGNTSFAPNRLRIAMQGAGECLVDAVEVFRDGTVTNLLANGDFESGPTGWTLSGNHSQSAVENTGAASGANCLHVRGQDNGDTGVNSIRTVVKGGLSQNLTGVIRAQVRWLKGWPEVLFRLQGNYLELPARMNVPANLGTPGQPNSRLVANAGPAIFDVNHSPALPRAGSPVVVTCRLSDPDGIGTVRVMYRVDPSATLKPVTLRDDGTSGDAVAGDGLYSALLPGQSSGALVAFRITAQDQAGSPASTVFPAGAPAQECLVRWDEPMPWGTFAHYHLWSTAATEQARGRSIGLDNTWRDATLVCGNFRVIYNAGFRDKGSPYHSGYGDIVATVPEDDLLLGTTERNFASTGNGGPEETDIRSQLSAWLAQKLGLPYLHAHYLRLYRNGGLFRSVCEDLEVPNREYTRRWFPDGARGDFYKISVWFEFQDDNLNFSSIGSTLERFLTVNNAYKTARYRWNWERRLDGGTANNFTNIFDLVTAANDTSTNYTARMMALADMEEWMRVFAYHRIMGNWDSWTYNVGQNMYCLKQPGYPWALIPWDIDFTFGLGDGSSAPLGAGSMGGNGQDPIGNRFYDNVTFKRMLWRAYQDAVAGPLLATNYQPQIDVRRAALLKNGVTDATDPRGITAYIEQRRKYILQRLAANDASQFVVTSNGGDDFLSPTPTTTLQGTAPFAVATIEVNGVPYPLSWFNQTTFRVVVPLPLATNTLVLVGKDLRGQPVPGATDTVTVTYAGAIPRVEDNVVINEVHYEAAEPNASFLELYNQSTSVPFDLSGYRLNGVGYVFPAGAIIQPNAYLVLVKDRAGFAKAYGATTPIFDEFPGSLDNGGEHLELIQAGATPAEDRRLCDVRYDDRLPWPTNAAGFGPSLQLIDPTQDIYRVGNWAATATNDLNRVTPGRANVTRQTLAPFPPVWINEVQPLNSGAFTDNAGEADPWIELYNAGTNAVDLSPYYLTDQYTNLTRWQFPAGTVIPAQGFLTVWADAQPAQTTSTAPHTNFRLSPANPSLALVRFQGSPSAAAVMDYLDCPPLAAGLSFGNAPDGEPRHRQWFIHVTPGGTNDAVWPAVPITVNEVLADNTKTLLNPASGKYDDWFELYNAGSNAVNLGGYFLTDDLGNPDEFVIPVGRTIPAHGFLLVWADNLSKSNQVSGDLHVDFKLAKDGQDIGLFAPSGALVDGLGYGLQATDVSVGRYPDGAELPLLTLDKPTPGATNYLAGGNRPPVFAPLADQSAAEGTPLRFTVSATDADPGQQITYSLGTNAPSGAALDATTGAFNWTPDESAGPGTITFALRATDNGTPPRTSTVNVNVAVAEVNQPPVLDPIADQTASQGGLLTLTLHGTDADLPPNHLTYRLDPGAPAGAQVDPATGEFTWIPDPALPPGSYALTAVVTDDGVPPLSGNRTFHVTVIEAPHPPVFGFVPPRTIEELTPLNLTVTATDPDTPPSALLYSLDLAPAGARIDSTTGAITWVPGESQGPTNAVFVVRATKVAPPNPSATTTFGVTVNEVNQAPAFAAIPDQVLEAEQALALTLPAKDPDLPPNNLTFSLEPGAPAGLTLDAGTGVLAWVPPGNQIPSTNVVSVRVTDDGVPRLAVVQTFKVVVKRTSGWRQVIATGTASSSTLYIYLTQPGEVYLDDLVLVPGSVADAGTNTVPDGDFETPLAGTWTVSPNHAGSDISTLAKHSGRSSLHIVASVGGTTRASSIYQDLPTPLENGAPYTLSYWYLPGKTTTSFTIRLSGSGILSATEVVGMANTPPVLAPIADRKVVVGQVLRFQATATDADQPAQPLNFELDYPGPTGASIDPAGGWFTWTPGFAYSGTTNQVRVLVTDGGVPPLGDFQSFNVVVEPSSLALIDARLNDNGSFTVTWTSIPQRAYRVESKTGLDDAAWQSFAPLMATGTTLSLTDPNSTHAARKFYRVVLIP